MNFKVYLITTFTLLLVNSTILATTRVSQMSGNWSNSSTWGGIVPAADDDIVISTGTIVNLNSSLPASSSFGSIVIKQGGTLVVGVDGVMLRLKGNLTNDGTIDLWKSATFQGDIILYGNSIWSGSGSWNLSDMNVQSNALELPEGSTITINGSITAYAGSSFNKQNRYANITLLIKGTLNSIIPSQPDFYYGNLVINKTTGTVDFLPSTSSNIINLLGDLTLVNATDQLKVTGYNTLSLQAGLLGLGVISGTTTSSLVVDNLDAAAINPLRILSGTSFSKFIINRRAGVTLSGGFIIRESLELNNSCLLTLPPQTLTLGVNGASPTAGKLSGNGSFIGSANSSISIRGKDTASVNIRFDQASVSGYTLNNLIIDKVSGKAGIANGNLIIAGKLDISDRNVFSIGMGTLIINIVPRFIGSGCLSGSKDASLIVGGTSTIGYSLNLDQGTPLGNTLRSYTQSRNAVITLANRLNISGRVSLTGSSSVLASNGNLTLLSSPEESAGIGPLQNNAEVMGDVNVQVHFTGDNSSMKYRGYRALSSPLNDALIAPGNKKSLEQLKQHIIITGRGGVANGFDQGGNAQPFAETITFYDPLAASGRFPFVPLNDIKQALGGGTGFLAFFRGRQKGNYSLNYSKLNSPYDPPEPVTVTYTGPVNKFQIPDISLRNSNDTTDAYRGYNLIGNPYPSAIDWTKVSRSVGVNDEVIILKPDGGSATYINGISNNGGSPYIQTGQGFYVRTSVDGSIVSFKEDCKTSSYPARLLVQPLKGIILSENITPETSDLIQGDTRVLRMNLANEDDKDEATIVFKSHERAEADYNDAIYFGGSRVNLASVSSNGKKLAINFMPEPDQLERIKLSINATNSGSYNINFTDIPKSSTIIFLKDSLYPDQLTKVEKNLSYCFSIDKKDPATFGDKRFSLVFKSKGDDVGVIEKGLPAVSAYPNPVTDKLYFDLADSEIGPVEVQIFGMKGGQKQLSELLVAEDHSIDVSFLEPGIYVAKLSLPYSGKSLSNIVFIKL